MTLTLPEPIARYFAADAGKDSDAVARCFAEDGQVKDEGHTHAGRAEIRDWKAQAATRYRYTATPVALGSDGERLVVTSHVAGDFPGSPVDLRYTFLLNGQDIAELEIAA